MKQTCILILGMHRSGTSALTGMLSLLDFYLGSELMEESIANVKGYFESNSLCRINDKLLYQMDSAWDDVFLDEGKISNVKDKDVDELKNHIKKEFKHSNNFAIKDPRISFLFPVYKRALGELGVHIKIVIPYRHPIEVARSLNRRNNFSYEKGILLWACHILLTEKFSRNYERVFIGYDELMSNSRSVVTLMSEKLHIDFTSKYTKNIKQINEFLEPGLKHHNLPAGDLTEITYKIVRDIFQIQGEFNDSAIIGKFDGLREELFSYRELFYNQEVVSVFSDLKFTKQNLGIAEQNLGIAKQNLGIAKQNLVAAELEIQKRTGEIQKCAEGLQQRTEELEQSKQLLGRKEQLLSQRDQEINAVKDELIAVYASRSWKMTEILRRINGLFK